MSHATSRPDYPPTNSLLSLLATVGTALPPEFWLHLGRGLQELGKALEILAEHGRTSAPSADEWQQLYERIMEYEPRVGMEKRYGG